MAYTLGDRAAKQIAKLVRQNERTGPPAGIGGNQGTFRDEYAVYGKIDGTMARNGTATLSVYKPGTAGGVGTDTGVNFRIIDVGMIPAAVSPIPANTVVMAHYMRGAWIIGSYDCDAV